MSKNSIQSTALEPGPDHYQGSRMGYVLHKLVRGIPVYGLVIACILLTVAFSLMLPESFPTLLNLRLLINNNAIVAILALAAMTPMVTGKIDLSVGYGVVLWEILMIGLTSQQGIPWPLTVIIILLLGTCYGVFNALLVEIAQIDAFIATLGTGSVLYAIALWYSDGRQIVGQLPDTFYLLESQSVFGVPIMAIYVLGIAVLLWLVLTFTPLGRYLYAVGANAEASKLNGIRTQRCIVLAFAVSGFLTALAGILLAAKLRIGQVSVGLEFLLPALVAAFLGTTTIKPGRVNVWGTMVAIVILAVGLSGLQQAGGRFYVEPLFNGLTLVIAIGMAGYAGRLRSRLGRSRDRQSAVAESDEVDDVNAD